MIPSPLTIRPYQSTDKTVCLALFESNTPEFFAAHEIAEFDAFLDRPTCHYFVVERDLVMVACGGHYLPPSNIAGLCWGLVHQKHHRQGIGQYLLDYRLHQLCQMGATAVAIDTSQHSAPFFEKSGFTTTEIILDCFTAGLHLYKMTLPLTDAICATLRQKLD